MKITDKQFRFQFVIYVQDNEFNFAHAWSIRIGEFGKFFMIAMHVIRSVGKNVKRTNILFPWRNFHIAKKSLAISFTSPDLFNFLACCFPTALYYWSVGRFHVA